MGSDGEMGGGVMDRECWRGETVVGEGRRQGVVVLGLSFLSGAVVCVRGCSFLFIVGVIVSWVLIISEWGSSLSMGDCHCSWALLFVGAIVVHGAGQCC